MPKPFIYSRLSFLLVVVICFVTVSSSSKLLASDQTADVAEFFALLGIETDENGVPVQPTPPANRPTPVNAITDEAQFLALLGIQIDNDGNVVNPESVPQPQSAKIETAEERFLLLGLDPTTIPAQPDPIEIPFTEVEFPTVPEQPATITDRELEFLMLIGIDTEGFVVTPSPPTSVDDLTQLTSEGDLSQQFFLEPGEWLPGQDGSVPARAAASISSVPEPSALLLLCGSTLALCCRRRGQGTC